MTLGQETIIKLKARALKRAETNTDYGVPELFESVKFGYWETTTAILLLGYSYHIHDYAVIVNMKGYVLFRQLEYDPERDDHYFRYRNRRYYLNDVMLTYAS